MNKKRIQFPFKNLFIPFLLCSCVILLSSCRDEPRQQDRTLETDDQLRTGTATTPDTIADRAAQVRIFQGDIAAINPQANENREVTGTVSLRVEGDLMRFHVTAEGLSPDMMHMQYLQTSERGEPVHCPGPDADVNKDGVIDVTEASSGARGERMIPLHMGPSSLEMNVDTYPRTNVNGQLEFARTVSMDSLRKAVRDEYGMQDLDFTNFTYVIQGVAEGTRMPQTVQSVSNVPAAQSIPVGCARLEEERRTTVY